MFWSMSNIVFVTMSDMINNFKELKITWIYISFLCDSGVSYRTGELFNSNYSRREAEYSMYLKEGHLEKSLSCIISGISFMGHSTFFLEWDNTRNKSTSRDRSLQGEADLVSVLPVALPWPASQPLGISVPSCVKWRSWKRLPHRTTARIMHIRFLAWAWYTE